MLSIRKFINDKSFQVLYRNNSLDIVNYDSINYMKDNDISISFNNCVLNIIGSDLRVKKLLESEILISGFIKSIKFINE